MTTALTRLSTWSGLLAGLAIAVIGGLEGFIGETAATSFVIALTPALATPLLVALHTRQARASGRFGELAFFVNLVGLGLYGGAAFALDMVVYYISVPLAAATKVALFGSAAVFAIGSVMFGISMLRTKVFPAIPTWGYTLILAVFAVVGPLPHSPIKSALHVLSGTTLIWLATSLMDRAPQRAPALATS
ncbi:hypothetical protein [Actinocrispum wychmicini]|nr:hypothetical protein [Actinocrispum wychmicini]